MAVETSAVQITINVTDANSGAVVAGVTQNLNKMGSAGATSGQKVAQSMDGVSKSMLSATEQTRLTTEVLGIRLPRAMISLISQSKAAQAALGAVGGAMIGLASIQIGVMIFGAATAGAEKLWHLMTGLSKGTEDYLAQVQKTKEEDFGNTRSIEDTRLRIDQASDSVKDFRDQAEAAKKETISWWSALNLIAPGAGNVAQTVHAHMKSNDLTDEAAKKQALIDKLQHVQEASQTHEQRISDIDIAAATRRQQIQKLSEAARPQAQRDLQVGEATRRAHEERRYAIEQSKALGNSVAPNSGADKETRAINLATIKADTELASVKQKTDRGEKARIQELARLHEEALESGLRGSALYQAQEAAAIEDLKRRHIATDQAVSDVHAKFHNEQMKRLEDENRQVAKMREAAQLSGLTGVARIQQEGQNKINDVYSRKGDTNSSARLAEIKAINDQTHQQIREIQQTFADRVNSIVEQTADRTVAGFARIHAEAQKQISDLERDAAKNGGKPADLARGTAGIRSAESGQVADLQRKNSEETSQIEAEARSKLLSSEKNQTSAIETEYEQRLHKYQEWKDQELSSDKLSLQERQSINEQFDRRVVAAGQTRDAALVESAQRAREKMAGEFSRFFSNPLSAMKEMGNKAAGEAAAALMQRVQTRVGTGGATGEHLGMPGSGMMDSLFGRIAGSPKGGASAGSASPKMLSFATAQIQIGAASIAFGGGGVAGGTHSRTPYTSAGSTGAGTAFSTSGGSTGLLAPEGASSTPAGSTAAPMSFGGSTAGSGAAPGGGTGAALGNAQQGMGLFSQGKNMLGGLFGGKGATSDAGAGFAETQSVDLSGSIDKTGNFNLGKGNTNGGMLGGGGFGANAGGAVGGAMGLYSAAQGKGGVGGALGGAMSGMQLGMAVGGPMGAAIGAAAGAIIGGIGSSEQARVYDLKTVRPRLYSDTLGYQQGTMDYTSAYSDMQSLDMEAKKTLKAMGANGNRYYWDTVIGEIHQAEGKLSAEQRAGRSNYTSQAAQFDIGADRIPRDGFAMIHQDERIVPSDQNERITRALESGADSTRMPVQGGFSGDIHLHAHSMDSKTVMRTLMDHKHDIRSAYNASFAENSGGADA